MDTGYEAFWKRDDLSGKFLPFSFCFLPGLLNYACKEKPTRHWQVLGCFLF